MIASLAAALAVVVAGQQGRVEPRLEQRLLARVPENLALQGKPIRSPDGATLVPVNQRVVWSEDGAAVGYVGLEGQVPRPVIGEQVLKAYHYASGPVFGRGGTHAAFRVGKRVEKDRERWWVLLDGKEVGAEDWIGEIALAPDGERYAAWTQPGAKIAADGAYDRGKQVLVTPWKPGAKWDDASSLIPPRFAPDGSFVATLAAKNSQWRLLVADKKGERELGPAQAFVIGYDVTADGKNCALVALDLLAGASGAPPPMPGMPGSKTVIVYGKQTLGREHESAGSPLFSPDGKRLAWVFRDGPKHGIAIGEGQPAPEKHDWIRGLVFRPDGKELAFAAGTGGTANPALVDEDEGAQIDGAEWRLVSWDGSGKARVGAEGFARIADITWSRDGARLAFAGQKGGNWFIVCGDKRSEAFDEVGLPRFTSDGAHLAFGGRKGRELWWIVLD